MERLSTQPATSDTNGGIALCYQLNQSVNVQTQNADNQTAVAVQSLLDSQVITDTQEEEEEDVFQCGKCKKQFSSLAAFISHKQAQCGAIQQLQQQQQQLQQQQHLQQQHQQSLTLQQPQQTQLTLNAGANAFGPTINLSQPFSQSQVQLNGALSSINAAAPIMQAHPCLTRSLNQPNNAGTLTLGGVPSSPMSQISHNMVFTDDLMALANIDTSALGGQAIQMVTRSLPAQAGGTANGMAIFSPVTSLAGTPAGNFSNSNTHLPASQLLMQPVQHITLTTITPDSNILHQQQQAQAQQLQTIQALQPQQQQQTATMLPTATQLVPPVTSTLVTPVVSQPASILRPTSQQLQAFKQSAAKAVKKASQSNSKFITVLNSENNLSVLSSRKTKTGKISKNGTSVEEEGSSKPKLQCEYCNKQFTKNFDLQQHVRAHTGEKPFQCIVCGRAFAQKSNVKKHMATHKVWPTGTSNTLPKQPIPVSNATTENTTLQVTSSPAQASVPSAFNHVSGAVTTALSTNQALLKSTVHQLPKPGCVEEKAAETKVKVLVDSSYVCQYCPVKFKTYYQLKTHLVTHKNQQVYKCVMKSCGQSFPQLESFLEHIKSHESELNYRCHQCNKYFKSLNDLGVHQYTHVYLNQGVKSGPRHFQCTKCGNKYTTPEALEHHVSTTSHDYKCPHCHKQFTCERFLRRHLPLHGTEGQFECHDCHKKFKTEHYLKSHMLIHTGETPFVCEICHAAFNRKDKLKRHMTIHETVKKYRCPFRTVAGCMKEFNRPDKLKAHIITHSGIKPFTCNICGKGFSRRPHLVEHERGHNLDYRFKCEKCGKGFFRPKHFAEHKCQPSKYGLPVQQTFVPRHRRKVGRPRKRMVTISPDSVAKSRGKQYLSRTRGKAKVMQQLPVEMAQSFMSVKQRLRRQQLQKRIKAEAELKEAEAAQMIQGKNNEGMHVTPVSSMSHNVVVSTGNQRKLVSATGVNIDTSIEDIGLESQAVTITKEEIPDVNCVESGQNQIQQISLTSAGELMDHYVVHLTDSVDGAGPTIQTAFIPAVSGGQIFASPTGGLGIQPIAIIEARSLAVGTSTSDASEGQEAGIMVSVNGNQEGEMQGTVVDVDNNFITVARMGSEGEIIQEGAPVEVEEEDKSTMIMLSDGGTTVGHGDVVAGSEGQLLATHHGSSLLMSVQGSEAGGSSQHCADVTVGSKIGEEEEEEEMEDNGTVMVIGSQPGEGEMMDLFEGRDSFVGGQVVVSGDQAYIACSSQLVDYASAE